VNRTQINRIVTALAVFLLVAGAMIVYAYFIEPQRLVVNRTELRIPTLDSRLDGLRIVAISDIHGGSNGADPTKLIRIVDEVNRQDADLVVMLGDYLSRREESPSGFAMEPTEIVRNLAGMRTKYGVYLVLGNHDTGRAADELITDFQSAGYNVLNGKLAVLNINGTMLRLLGLKDHQQIGIWKNYSDDAKAMLASTEGQGDVIVLQHSPDILPIITGDLSISKDLKLMISGHTHGGQVRLPIVGPPFVPSGYGQKYAAGQVTDAKIDIFVTSGIGTSILPFRFMVPPEIAVMTLRAG
jgi:uncharacterized protein